MEASRMDRKMEPTVTFISAGVGWCCVEPNSNRARSRRLRFNRWQYEPVIILLLPLLTVLSIFGALFFWTLESWIGDALARLVVLAIVVLILFGNAFLFLRRPRRERSP